MSRPRPNARAVEKSGEVNAAPFHVGDAPQRSSRSARIAGTDENGLQAPFWKALELLEGDGNRSIDQACYVQLPVMGIDSGNAHRAEFEQVLEPRQSVGQLRRRNAANAHAIGNHRRFGCNAFHVTASVRRGCETLPDWMPPPPDSVLQQRFAQAPRQSVALRQ